MFLMKTSGLDSSRCQHVVCHKFWHELVLLCTGNIRGEEKRKVWIHAECPVLCISAEKKASSERRKWLEHLRHDLKFDPSRKASNFSLHFMDGKATSEHPFPDLFAYNNFKESRKVTVLNYFMFHLKIIIHFAQIKCIGMILIFLNISARSIGV